MPDGVARSSNLSDERPVAAVIIIDLAAVTWLGPVRHISFRISGSAFENIAAEIDDIAAMLLAIFQLIPGQRVISVSYTHLTLPTKRIV